MLSCVCYVCTYGSHDNGKPTAVPNGVDVEAEVAYKGESYVEWYSMDDTGRLVKKEKRPVPGGKKEAFEAEATVTSAPAKTEDIIDDDERKRSNTVLEGPLHGDARNESEK